MPQKSYEDILTDALADQILSRADQIAAEHGGASGTQRPTTRQEIAAWGRTDPSVNFDALRMRLMTTGLAPEEAQQLILVKQYPGTLEALMQPQPFDVADALARSAEYPFRHPLYEHLDPDERVRYATSTDRAWQKSLTQPAPGPEMPDDPARMVGG